MVVGPGGGTPVAVGPVVVGPVVVAPGGGRLVVAFATAAAVQPLLFGILARDPGTYLAVALMLVLTAGIAGSLPAWRATRVDPREALQAD